MNSGEPSDQIRLSLPLPQSKVLGIDIAVKSNQSFWQMYIPDELYVVVAISAEKRNSGSCLPRLRSGATSRTNTAADHFLLR